MKTQRPVLTLLCASLLSVFAAQAIADDGTQTPTGVEATRLANRYATFAGSESNAEALVDALRNGTEVTLDSTTTTTVTNPDGTTSTTTTTTPVTFQPATGKLGWGNVNIALALAQDELNQMGITDPTADQIEAVLNGGDLTSSDGTTTQTLQGVLALRAEGEGWGQIANTLGFKLGDVVSASNNGGHSQAGAAHGGSKLEVASSHPDRADRPEHPVRPDRPQRPDRPDRPDRPQRPDRPDRPDHVGRPGG